jgi:hypothetical protein
MLGRGRTYYTHVTTTYICHPQTEVHSIKLAKKAFCVCQECRERGLEASRHCFRRPSHISVLGPPDALLQFTSLLCSKTSGFCDDLQVLGVYFALLKWILPLECIMFFCMLRAGLALDRHNSLVLTPAEQVLWLHFGMRFVILRPVIVFILCALSYLHDSEYSSFCRQNAHRHKVLGCLCLCQCMVTGG